VYVAGPHIRSLLQKGVAVDFLPKIFSHDSFIKTINSPPHYLTL
jgi:hypothetical protein